MEVVSNKFIPGDPRIIDQIVYELKSQGIFDQFRKECISDVDTKPAYQNLRQRVEGNVSNFLMQQKWKPDMNKNQVREMLRKNIFESGFLEVGVERIVDQVVNPKINTIFHPKVEEVGLRYLGIIKPNSSDVKKEEPLKVEVDELLPKDLDAISPCSVTNEKKEVAKDLDTTSEDIKEEDESPPFEPLEEAFNLQEDNSVDSHMSGFSGLASHESNQSSDTKAVQVELSNQDSQLSRNSSESHLSILTSEENTKMDISEDSQSKSIKQSDAAPEKSEIEPEDTKANDESNEAEAESNKGKSDDKKSRSSTDNKHRSRSEKDRKDDRKSSSSSSNKDKSRYSSSSSKDKSRERKDSPRDSRSTSSKDKNEKSKSSSSSSKHSTSSSRDKDRSSSRKDNKDRDKSKSSSTSSKDAKYKSSHGDSKSKSSSSDKVKKDEKHSHSSRHSSSSSSRKEKDKRRDSKKDLKDDHYSSKDKRTDRRSTDRDSNDGNSNKTNNSSSTFSESSVLKASHESSVSSGGKSTGDSGNSDTIEKLGKSPINISASIDGNAEVSIATVEKVKLYKPKFASNIHEAKKLMKIRKQLSILEKQNELTVINDEADARVQEDEKPEEKLDEKPEEPLTGGANAVLSKESWEALEARLYEEMSTISNSYESVEDEHNENEEVNNVQCKYLEKPTESIEMNLVYLNSYVEKLEKDINKSGVNKRKIDYDNNNEKSEVAEKKQPTTEKDIVKAKSLITDLSVNQNFTLPLSPAESDVSNEKKDESPEPRPKRPKNNLASQRYSSDDLYKPRPMIGVSRRRGNRKLEN